MRRQITMVGLLAGLLAATACHAQKEPRVTSKKPDRGKARAAAPTKAPGPAASRDNASQPAAPAGEGLALELAVLPGGLRLTLVNRGNEARTYFGEHTFHHSRLVLRRGGEEVVPGDLRQVMSTTAEAAQRTAAHVKTIPAGGRAALHQAQLGEVQGQPGTRRLSWGPYVYMLTPGTYAASAVLENRDQRVYQPKTRDHRTDPQIWTGRLVSNEVQLTVE